LHAQVNATVLEGNLLGGGSHSGLQGMVLRSSMVLAACTLLISHPYVHCKGLGWLCSLACFCSALAAATRRLDACRVNNSSGTDVCAVCIGS
jgi:hypothetical protein